ncbi:DNA-binding MarR family transcriptional regulator [Altererythrobacter atlanticus]|uniref:MarR family protein n=1 Tax=Croceibacterium atlanticum TaxID=1267766 RepID=A0A0F7KXB9_9SPHN|nr:MarR family transcriptional regulator [Croceibacterium atlanticum]AKH44324.1 MarR family protein [Croceibacterium atlanticum]MBB5733893.1 DNA-binding MarR family transcriptional regulator [Croceibacterium atlanticum]
MGQARTGEQESEVSAREKPRPSRRTGPLARLVSMRMVVLFNLMRRSNLLTQRRLLGLAEIEWRIVAYLGEFAPLSLNGLAEMLLQDRGQLSRTVKSMVKRGLLTRERKPGGPEIEIDLSAEGQALHQKMIERAMEWDRRLTEGLDPADLETVRRALDHMIGRAETIMEEEREEHGD